MPANIGAKIGLEGEAEFKKALKDIAEQSKLLSAEMKKTTSAFDDDTKAKDKAKQAGEVLSKQIENQKTKVELLKEQLKKTAETYGENSSEAKKLQTQLYNAEAELNNMEKESDELGESMKKTSEHSSAFGDTMKAVGAAVASAAAAAAAAAFELAKNVVSSFGELEQNLGGSEAVFGDYANSLQTTAAEAYKNMALSQSDYLATANKMGALFQGAGLTQEKSLDMTTQAMQRAADMASVMGIDTADAMEAITGAAKGNYTMMDNLGIAMNATTLEAYAAAQGFDTAFSKMDNAQKAEVAMQYFFENTSQYAGNFARESSETISGSIGMLTASVESFVAGLGNSEADIGLLTNNMVNAFASVVENITPVIANIVQALPTAVGAVIDAVGSMLPDLLAVAVELFDSVLSMLVSVLPELIPVILDAVLLITDTLITNLPLIIDAAIQIIAAVTSGIGQALPTLIPAIVDCIFTIVDTLLKPSGIDMLVNATITLMEGLTRGIIQAIPRIVQAIPQVIAALIGAIARNLPELLKSGLSMIGELASGIIKAIPVALKAIGDLLVEAKNKLVDKGKLKEWGKDMIQGFIDGIKSMISNIGQAASEVANKIKSFLHFSRPDVGPLRDYETWMPDMVKGMVKGIHQSQGMLDSAMYDLSARATGAMTSGFGIGGGQMTNLGGVSINVYGAEGQNANDIAEAVMDRLQMTFDGRTAAWA